MPTFGTVPRLSELQIILKFLNPKFLPCNFPFLRCNIPVFNFTDWIFNVSCLPQPTFAKLYVFYFDIFSLHYNYCFTLDREALRACHYGRVRAQCNLTVILLLEVVAQAMLVIMVENRLFQRIEYTLFNLTIILLGIIAPDDVDDDGGANEDHHGEETLKQQACMPGFTSVVEKECVTESDTWGDQKD